MWTKIYWGDRKVYKIQNSNTQKLYHQPGYKQGATGAHFNLPGHSLADMKFKILKQVKYNEYSDRKEREAYHINKLFNNQKNLSWKVCTNYDTLQAFASISVSKLCNFQLPYLVNLVNKLVFWFCPNIPRMTSSYKILLLCYLNFRPLLYLQYMKVHISNSTRMYIWSISLQP